MSIRVGDDVAQELHREPQPERGRAYERESEVVQVRASVDPPSGRDFLPLTTDYRANERPTDE